jgi:hypothetical protein
VSGSSAGTSGPNSGLDALAAALRLHSLGAPAHVNCALVCYLPIVITVTDTKGRQLNPKVPHEACGGPLPAAIDAIVAVPWRTVATRQVRQMQSRWRSTRAARTSTSR